jgi:NAD(P)-dependent dehydrogenase (short-subunit alcohol dehydrogenase family)
MRFSGKKVVVAGGTGGINLAIAQAFAKEGAGVAVFSRRPERVEAGNWRSLAVRFSVFRQM